MAETTPPDDAAVLTMWQDLLDKDDRTSPAEYPEMALITFDEFRAAVLARMAHPLSAKCEAAVDRIVDRATDRRAVIEACVAALKDKQKMLIDVGCDGPVVNAFSSAMGVIRALADKKAP